MSPPYDPMQTLPPVTVYGERPSQQPQPRQNALALYRYGNPYRRSDDDQPDMNDPETFMQMLRNALYPGQFLPVNRLQFADLQKALHPDNSLNALAWPNRREP